MNTLAIAEKELQQDPVEGKLPQRVGTLETPDSMIYLGVELKKRRDEEMVPKAERFKGHVITSFDAWVSQQIAVSLDLNQPLLIEGGSGIGKTSTLERMCAELGWNLWYINCYEFEPEMIVGAVRDDETTKSGFGFRASILPKGTEKGGIILLDEFNRRG